MAKQAVLPIHLPDELELYIGGYGGPCYQVKLVEGQLYYSDQYYDSLEQIKQIIPTTVQWQSFGSSARQVRRLELGGKLLL